MLGLCLPPSPRAEHTPEGSAQLMAAAEDLEHTAKEIAAATRKKGADEKAAALGGQQSHKRARHQRAAKKEAKLSKLNGAEHDDNPRGKEGFWKGLKKSIEAARKQEKIRQRRQSTQQPVKSKKGSSKQDQMQQSTMDQQKEDRRTPDNAACAVVFSSGSLLKNPMGARINGFSRVMRFNMAPTGGEWEQYAGSKTTDMLVHDDRDEGESPAQKLADAGSVIQHVNAITFNCPGCQPTSIKELQARHPRWTIVDEFHWKACNKLMGYDGNHGCCSTGLMGVLYAMQECTSVTVFGAVHDQCMPNHYWEQVDPRCDQKTRQAKEPHDFAMEHSVLKQLHDQHRIEVTGMADTQAPTLAPAPAQAEAPAPATASAPAAATDAPPTPAGCNWECYISNYKDLQPLKSLQNPQVAAAEHWSKFGSKEGRDCACKSTSADLEGDDQATA